MMSSLHNLNKLSLKQESPQTSLSALKQSRDRLVRDS